MPKIFLSYRRDDSLGQTSRLYDRLIVALGREHVFCDKATLKLGEWPSQISDALAEAEINLVIIGRGWLSPRLSDSNDQVRVEIEQSLKNGATIVPLLVDGADLPAREELPPSLRPILNFQAARLSAESHTAYNNDIEALISLIREHLRNEPIQPTGSAGG